MRRIDLGFIILATTTLLVGVGIGTWMGLTHNFHFAPVHAHLNLLGWTSLAIFGLCYRVYPALAASRLALPHFALAAGGAICFPVGIALSITDVTMEVAKLGALLWTLAVLLFLVALVRLALAGRAAANGEAARPLTA